MEHPRGEEPDTQQPDDFDDAHFHAVMEAGIDDYLHGRFVDIDL